MATWNQIAVKDLRLDSTGASRDARFAELVERRSRFLFSIAWALLRNVPDAEDAVQETLLKLYRTGAWERMKDEKAFLARTVWRVALEKLPGNRAAAVDVEAQCPAADPERAAIAANWNEVVHRLIDALSEELRQPLGLSALEEWTSKEIAEVMAIPEGTVRTRLMRARAILKQKLAELMDSRNER